MSNSPRCLIFLRALEFYWLCKQRALIHWKIRICVQRARRDRQEKMDMNGVVFCGAPVVVYLILLGLYIISAMYYCEEGMMPFLDRSTVMLRQINSKPRIV